MDALIWVLQMSEPALSLCPTSCETLIRGHIVYLQALGIAVDIGPESVARCLEEVGLGFMFAPRYTSANKSPSEFPEC